MWWPFKRKQEEEKAPSYSPSNPPPRLPDARVYVAHGDIMWGNSITHRTVGPNELDVTGWLSRAPFPRVGDVLLVKMESGKWGWWLFSNVRPCGNPSDMFVGCAVGAFGYGEEIGFVPKLRSPDEFIENLSPFMRT
jgi:hypothetical protein